MFADEPPGVWNLFFPLTVGFHRQLLLYCCEVTSCWSKTSVLELFYYFLEIIKWNQNYYFFSPPAVPNCWRFFFFFLLYTHAWRSLISLWKRIGGVWISQCELEIIFRCSSDCYSQSVALVWGDVITAYSNWTSVFLQHAARQQNWTLTLTWISMLQHQGWAHCASGCVAFVHVVSQWIAENIFLSIILRLNWYIQWTWIKMKCGGKQHEFIIKRQCMLSTSVNN